MYSGSRPAANARTTPASDKPPRPPAPVALAGGCHHGLGHPRARGQNRLHLTGLNPEPPDLDLIISTPRELQLPITGPPGHIPGPVHPLPAAPERASHKPLRRQ